MRFQHLAYVGLLLLGSNLVIGPAKALDPELDTAIVANLGGKCGYVDAKGKFLIPAKYQFADRFYPDGLAVVQMANSDQSLMINHEGDIQMTGPKGMWIADWARDDVFLMVDDGKHTGFIDRSGAIKIPLVWDEAYGFGGHALAPVKRAGKWGYIGRDGKLKIEAIFLSAESFKNGKAKVSLGVKSDYLLSENGTMEPFKSEPRETAEKFVRDNQRKIGELYYFTKNSHGIEVANIKTATNSMMTLVDSNRHAIGKAYVYIALDEDTSLVLVQSGSSFKEGAPPLRYGFVGTDGKVIIPLSFSEADGFNGRETTIVALKGKWGTIDRKGRWIIRPKFDRLGQCTESTVRMSR
jgi:WG containing repeat